MKIGIVTFFSVPNYGAMLQAFALWKFLEELGHGVEFIDYAFGNTQRIPLWRCFIARHFSNYRDVVRRKLKSFVRFDIVKFSDIFPRTQRISTFKALKEIGSKFDAFIVGSDQMWNPIWCSGAQLPIVMLDFAIEGKSRIAYATSFGGKEWRKDQNAGDAGRFLRKMTAISVREQSGVDLVRRLSGRTDAKCLIDPTLLYTASFYRQVFAKENLRQGDTNEPFIFSYLLDEWSDDKSAQPVLEYVRKVLGVTRVVTDRVAVSGFLGPFCRAIGVESKVPVCDWLSRISASEFVLTNSFHGTVFAILFHRPFVSILLRGKMSGMNERILSLLGKVGLESRAIYADDLKGLTTLLTEKVDWRSVDASLDDEREYASDYLFGSLGLMEEPKRKDYGK